MMEVLIVSGVGSLLIITISIVNIRLLKRIIRLQQELSRILKERK